MKEDILKKSMRYYPKENEEYWKQHRSGFLASGLSRRMYCTEYGVNYDRFHYWFRKLSPHQKAAPSGKESSEKNGLLLPVHLSQEKPNSLSTPLCTLNLKNGHLILLQ
jgi:hypothetical protein